MAVMAVALVMVLSSAIVLTADKEAVADADTLDWGRIGTPPYGGAPF